MVLRRGIAIQIEISLAVLQRYGGFGEEMDAPP